MYIYIYGFKKKNICSFNHHLKPEFSQRQIRLVHLQVLDLLQAQGFHSFPWENREDLPSVLSLKHRIHVWYIC